MIVDPIKKQHDGILVLDSLFLVLPRSQVVLFGNQTQREESYWDGIVFVQTSLDWLLEFPWTEYTIEKLLNCPSCSRYSWTASLFYLIDWDLQHLLVYYESTWNSFQECTFPESTSTVDFKELFSDSWKTESSISTLFLISDNCIVAAIAEQSWLNRYGFVTLDSNLLKRVEVQTNMYRRLIPLSPSLKEFSVPPSQPQELCFWCSLRIISNFHLYHMCTT